MTEPTRPPTKHELGLQLLRLTDIATAARKAADDIKHVLQGAGLMVPGDHMQPTIPTGDPIEPPGGTVTYRHPSQSIVVTDEPAFREWVDDHHPGEVEMVERVRPAFLARFVNANGIVVGPDGDIDIPGISVATGSASIAAVTDKKNLDQLRNNARSLTLGELLDVPAIEAGNHE